MLLRETVVLIMQCSTVLLWYNSGAGFVDCTSVYGVR